MDSYKIGDYLGKGSYGIVKSAIYLATGEQVAIKIIPQLFENHLDTIRILRELKILWLLKPCDRIVKVRDIIIPPSASNYDHIRIVFEKMDMDLRAAIKYIEPIQHDYIMFQLLEGICHVHACGILHRDIKPANILINKDCTVKLADFGLARFKSSPQSEASVWSGYVSTRWYRAPELLGSFQHEYTNAIDMWALGCVYAEMLLKRPLFPGGNTVDQLNCIMSILGKPADDFIEKIPNKIARKFFKNAPKYKSRMDDLFAHVPPKELDLLKQLLVFDPSERISAFDALRHPLFVQIKKSEEPIPEHIFNVVENIKYCEEFSANESVLREAIYVHACANSLTFTCMDEIPVN